jgi:hypothetical protein
MRIRNRQPHLAHPDHPEGIITARDFVVLLASAQVAALVGVLLAAGGASHAAIAVAAGNAFVSTFYFINRIVEPN